MSRRVLQYVCCFAAVLLAFIFLAPCRPLFPADNHYEVREIQPHVFVWVADDILYQDGDPDFNRATNAGFIITPNGVVVVNTTNSPFNGRALLYEIRKRTDLPIQYVIDTGGSPDETLGNEVFEDFRPTILSTPAAATAMRHYQQGFSGRVESDWRLQIRMRGMHPTLPNRTFDHDFTLSRASQQIKVINLGANSTAGDAAVYLPAAKVLFLGSVFENEYIPRIGAGNIQHWIETLRQVETWDVNTYVPGHGDPGGKQQVREFRNFLEWLSNQVESRIRQGKTLEQVQAEMESFQNYHWHAPELEPQAVAAVYWQLNAARQTSASPVKTPSP